MKSIDKLREQGAKIGVTIDEGNYTVNLDAPSGYVWAANHCCAYAIHYATNSQTWLSKALADEMPSIKMGLVKVTDENEIAEHRHSLDDDSWGAAGDAPLTLEWPK